MVIVDMTVWVDSLRGTSTPEVEWLERELGNQRFALTDVIDCLIATFCLLAGHASLHADRDFDPFEEHLALRVVPPGHND